MARELAVSIYLFIIKLLFNVCNQFPQKKKTVLVASFGDNIWFTLKELEKQTDETLVILKTASCKTDFSITTGSVIEFHPVHFLQWLRSIYHLATAKTIFIDNYFGFLAVTTFRSNVRCIQLWHAAGAIKKFGLQDPSIAGRSKRALNRFRHVYQQFTHVVTGSEKMADIFRKSFELPDKNMIRTGIPRSDLFYDTQKMNEINSHFHQQYPITNHKKVILYAPTYRDDELKDTTIALDIARLYKQLGNDYVLFLKLHPAVTYTFHNHFAEFVYDVSAMTHVNHLLMITDILITDYSSIPFEFSLLKRPMIFFAYDLDKYEMTRGFWEDYETLVPGPVVTRTEDIIDVIQHGIFNEKQIKNFSDEWNSYSKGDASWKLINALYRDKEQYQIPDQEKAKT